MGILIVSFYRRRISYFAVEDDDGVPNDRFGPVLPVLFHNEPNLIPSGRLYVLQPEFQGMIEARTYLSPARGGPDLLAVAQDPRQNRRAVLRTGILANLA